MPRQNNETDLEYKRRVIDIKSESFCGAKGYEIRCDGLDIFPTDAIMFNTLLE